MLTQLALELTWRGQVCQLALGLLAERINDTYRLVSLNFFLAELQVFGKVGLVNDASLAVGTLVDAQVARGGLVSEHVALEVVALVEELLAQLTLENVGRSF